MRSLKKNIAAGVVGAILLSGVGGTFALWTARTEGQDLGRVQAGYMEITTGPDGSWTLPGPGGVVDVPLSSIIMIPGDVVRSTFDVTASFNATSPITATLTAAELPGHEASDLNLVRVGDTNTWRIFDGDRETSFVVRVDLKDAVLSPANTEATFDVEIEFQAGHPSANADMRMSDYLGDVHVILTQNTAS